MATTDFFIKNEPNRFGGRQEDYKKYVKNVINSTAFSLKESKKNNENLIELFHQTLALLAEQRHQLAKEHNSFGAEDFGKRRDNPRSFCPYLCTDLIGPYREYGDKILKEQFYPKLKNMEEKNKSGKNELFKSSFIEKSFNNKKCLNKSSSIQFNVWLGEDFMKKKSFWHPEHYERVCKICEIHPRLPYQEKSFVKDILFNKECMFKLKTKSPADYKQLKEFQCVMQFVDNLWQTPSVKPTHFVFATMRCEINEKSYAFSQYVTFFNDHCPLEEMLGLKGSRVGLIHQDPFLIKDVLSDCAKIFERVLQCDSKKVETIKEMVALLNYELSHATPFVRGSAAIIEWMEQAIFCFHGFTLKYNPKKMVNLEALTLPLNEFVKNYNEMVMLTPVLSDAGILKRHRKNKLEDGGF